MGGAESGSSSREILQRAENRFGAGSRDTHLEPPPIPTSSGGRSRAPGPMKPGRSCLAANGSKAQNQCQEFARKRMPGHGVIAPARVPQPPPAPPRIPDTAPAWRGGRSRTSRNDLSVMVDGSGRLRKLGPPAARAAHRRLPTPEHVATDIGGPPSNSQGRAGASASPP